MLEARQPEEDAAFHLQRMADKVASMIVTSTSTDLDCALAERELRMEFLTNLPESMHLFDLIYVSRFQRLRDQFRGREADYT